MLTMYHQGCDFFGHWQILVGLCPTVICSCNDVMKLWWNWKCKCMRGCACMSKLCRIVNITNMLHKFTHVKREHMFFWVGGGGVKCVCVWEQEQNFNKQISFDCSFLVRLETLFHLIHYFVHTCMDSPSMQCLGFSTTIASTPAITPVWFRDTSLPKLDKLVLLTASRGRLCLKTVNWTSPFMTSKSHVITDWDSLIVTSTCTQKGKYKWALIFVWHALPIYGVSLIPSWT